MTRNRVWLGLVALSLAALARPAWAAEPGAEPPDAQMLLDLDLLKDPDFGNERGLLRQMGILERLRLLESLGFLESESAIAPTRGEVKSQ